MPMPNQPPVSSASEWYDDAIKLAEDRHGRYLATPPEEIR